MARNFIYVHERICKEEKLMKQEFSKLAVSGKRTPKADLRRIQRIISDSAYKVARECSVIVTYPQMHIEGTQVVLGSPKIMLPNCRIVTIEQLRKIES